MADTFAPDSDIDLRRIWGILLKNKWVIMGFPVVIAVLAYFAVGFITPTFQARASILIENVDANTVSVEQVYGLERRNAQYFDTQYAILRSRPLVETVAEDLELASHPEYDPEQNKTPEWRDWRSMLGIKKKPSRLSPEERAVYIYMSKISIRPVPRTQIVDVVFESSDPRLAAKVANAHAQAYIESMMDARLGMTETAVEWMTTKLDELQAALSESEGRLQEYREQHGVIDYDGLKALPSQEIGDLTSSLADARRVIAQRRAAFFQVYPGGGSDLAGNLSGISAVQDDVLSQGFQVAVASAQAEVDELSKRLGPSHPTMIDAQAALARAQDNLAIQHRQVADRIRNEYEEATAEESQIASALALAKNRYQAIGRTEADFRSLERDVESNRELYGMFYARLKETAQAGDFQQAGARILSPAIRPIRPESPDRNLIVGLALVGSLLLAIVGAFLVEALNDKVDVANIEKNVDTDLLSMIPLVSNRKKFGPPDLLFESGKHPAFKEAVRTLRTGVALSGSDELSKVLLITSSVGDEGKTTVSINLASAFAQMEKVLLIDGDLRKPSVGRRLGLPLNAPGFADVLSKSAELERCVIQGSHENLDILPAGSIPEDALQLLSSRRLSSLMRVLRIKYDRIIIDSPPTLPVSDAPVLAGHADSVIIVTKSKATRLIQVKSTISKLKRVAANITGVVVNQWDMRDQTPYGVYGYYQYGNDAESEDTPQLKAG